MLSVHGYTYALAWNYGSKQGMRCACPNMLVHLGTRCQLPPRPWDRVRSPVVFCSIEHQHIFFFFVARSRPSSIADALLAPFYSAIRSQSTWRKRRGKKEKLMKTNGFSGCCCFLIIWRDIYEGHCFLSFLTDPSCVHVTRDAAFMRSFFPPLFSVRRWVCYICICHRNQRIAERCHCIDICLGMYATCTQRSVSGSRKSMVFPWNGRQKMMFKLAEKSLMYLWVSIRKWGCK